MINSYPDPKPWATTYTLDQLLGNGGHPDDHRASLLMSESICIALQSQTPIEVIGSAVSRALAWRQALIEGQGPSWQRMHLIEPKKLVTNGILTKRILDEIIATTS